MSETLAKLSARADEPREELHQLAETVKARIMDGGHPMTADEKQRVAELEKLADQRKEDYEAQRDLEALHRNQAEDRNTVERELAEVREATAESQESARRALRDAAGPSAVRDLDTRAAEQMRAFNSMSDTTTRTTKLQFNLQAARQFRDLREAGLSPADYVNAVVSGRGMLETEQGDVRIYGVGGGTTAALIPTFWDESLYLFASYIGGVQNSGAMVIPVAPSTTVRLPKVTAYASGLASVDPGTTITTETNDTIAHDELNTRAYRGFAAETDELRRSASIDTRMLLAMRSLSRALQLGKEADFHNGNGTNKPDGILNAIPAGRITDTASASAGFAYGTVPAALANLNAEYHTGPAGNLVFLVHSARWFADFVGQVATDGHPVYPHLMMGGEMSRGLFGARVNFSHLLAATVASDANLGVVGDFYNGYVIATGGMAEVEVSDEARFLDWEYVYRIQEYCDGTRRDANAFAWIQGGS